MTQTTSTLLPCRDEIYRRLDNVYDPELDESILKLGFVDEVQIEGSDVTVLYRLPTYWCAPNFAYMMSADVRTEVGQVPGVQSVRVVLSNHCTETEINSAVNRGASFREAFPDDALDDLDDLRRRFFEKSFLARQEQLIRRLRHAGLSDEQIVALRLSDLTLDGEDVLVKNQELRTKNQGDADVNSGFLVLGSSATRVRLGAGDLAKYLRKRRLLGLPDAPVDGLFCALDGTPLSAEELPDYLRRTRTMRVSLAFNTTLCEGLRRTQYNPERISDTSSVADGLLWVKG